MNKYFLYVETIDEDGEIIEKLFIDVFTAESIDDCLRKSWWTGEDEEDNEQYCIVEEDCDGCELGAYYPFGYAKVFEEIKKRPKYSDSIMTNVRQRFGLEPDDTSMDEEINKMDPTAVLDSWLAWEGIYGYTNKIVEVVEEIYGGFRNAR